MNLMLVVLLAFVGVGLFTPRFGSRTYLLIGAISTLMTGLFYFTTRFMT
jgi:hypothetical protein